MDLAATAGPHVLVADLESCAIDADDWHHLARVLRLRDGDPLSVSDGNGNWRTAEFAPDALKATGPVHAAAPPRPVSVGFALVKGAKPDLIVQKLTELGVGEIVPFVAARSVVKWDEAKRSRAQERLELIARNATMQSKGAWLPSVSPVVTFADLVADATPTVRADIGAPVLGADGPEHRRVLVGPEGGWSDEERVAMPAAVGVHFNVLRSETAAIAVGVLLTTQM